jgi:hypothetical protein
MATCIRNGNLYKRHNYKPAISAVDGTELDILVCVGCGKEKVKQIILDIVTEV